MSRISITVSDEVVDYAERQVRAGRFRSIDEVFEDAVRTDQDQRRLTTTELHEMLDLASASGASPRRLSDIMDEVEAKLRANGRL